VLGISGVGVEDNFFERGGDSLAGLQVVRALKAEAGLAVSEVTLFENPTVAALCRHIAAAHPEGDAFAHARAQGERRRQRRSEPVAARIEE
jgi:aryl carrier-like protein